ncbi:MAG: type II toxin-antitoxin system VapC family toxin [Chloroflexota bacterium]
MLVTDASIWVSRLYPGDFFHRQVTLWMASCRSENIEFVAPSLLLAEIGSAISRRTGDPSLALRAIEQVKNLPGLRLLEMEHSLAEIAASLAAELGLRGTDSVYAAAAYRLNLPLATLDADQKNRAKTIIEIIELP